jgi:hypothetical protein
MKKFTDPASGETFCCTLTAGPGMASTLAFHASDGKSKWFLVPSAKRPEAVRAYNRPHRPENIISLAEGLQPLPIAG